MNVHIKSYADGSGFSLRCLDCGWHAVGKRPTDTVSATQIAVDRPFCDCTPRSLKGNGFLQKGGYIPERDPPAVPPTSVQKETKA